MKTSLCFEGIDQGYLLHIVCPILLVLVLAKWLENPKLSVFPFLKITSVIKDYPPLLSVILLYPYWFGF